MRVVDVQMNKRDFRVSATVTLRECSVVIIGSTCRICGRDFKCESDVAVHTRWRHNNHAMGSLMDILDRQMNLKNVNQKCDVCDMPFEMISDLKFHKRLIHKNKSRYRGKRQRGKIRVKFKLNGVTTTDVSLDRKYIKIQDSFERYVDVYTQTPIFYENERYQDNCSGNIDLSLPNHVVNENHIQYGMRPNKAANRYIVGKFASTKGNAIAHPVVVAERSLVEISNIDTIPDSDDLCKENCEDHYYLVTAKNAEVAFVESFINSTNTHDKENLQRRNGREKRNTYCRSEISLSDDFLACQSEEVDKTLSMSKQNSWSSENRHYIVRWSDEIAKTQETDELTNSLLDSMEIILDNEKRYDFNENGTKLPPSLSRLNQKNESIKVNSSTDDDVQEVLRITRGNAHNDINHESPNRMEREILIQNVISETLPSQLEPIVYPKVDIVFTTNFQSSDCPSFMVMTENDYQFLTNSFDKRLSICLEDHHCGIRHYNDIAEINNNNLEEYKKNSFETSKRLIKSQYTNESKVKDNEVTVVLD
ncbi:hypothetical protein P5V15_012207 [Pogonomyrmex californicus]